jgi:hypothetical protein
MRAATLALVLGHVSATPMHRINRMGGFVDKGVDVNAEEGIHAQLPGVRKPMFTRPMIDPATPASAKTTQNKDTAPYNLVFSDEFNTDGRSFVAGADPYWTAVDHFNPTTSDLEMYSSKAVTTKGGNMVITATMTPDQGHPYTSGMLTSWNQFCMTSGIVEVKVQLPGDPSRPGLWPAVWMMGNLARAGYTMTTDETWPWSYDSCDGNSMQWQKFSACNASQHPGEGAHGRGGPEFDILETNICPTQTKTAGVSDLMRCPNDTATDGAYKAGPRLFSTMHFTPKNPSNAKYHRFGTQGSLQVLPRMT